MQVTATVAAAALATTALAGSVAGAVLHAATANVRVAVECPAPPVAAHEDGSLRRFLSPPAPSATGGARY